jgi:hypothetical protein
MRGHTCWSISSSVQQRAESKRTEMKYWEANHAISPVEQKNRHTSKPSSQRWKPGQHLQKSTSTKGAHQHSPCPRLAAPRPVHISRTIYCPACPNLFKARLPTSLSRGTPIKDEPLPNMILFSFVTVVLLELYSIKSALLNHQLLFNKSRR